MTRPAILRPRIVRLLLSLLLLVPQLALAQVKVEVGSTGNKAILSINNGNESVVEGVRVEVFESPKFVENVTIKPTRLPALAAGKSQDIEIEFSVRADARPGSSGELEFLITSKVGMFDDPTPGLPLLVVPRLNPAKALVRAFPIKPDAPDDFPVENAIDYCDFEREPTEYDRMAVFFTPPYDVSEPLDEKGPFMWLIQGPNGDKQNGGSGTFAPKHAEPSFAKDGSPGRFVAVLDLWRRGDSPDPAKARSGPGTYTVQTVAADYGVTGTFGQGEATVVLATTGRDENGEPIYAEWEELKTFEIKSLRLYFQGFVMESVNDVWLPDREDIWEGKLNVAYPQVSGSTVVLGADAWIRKAHRDGTGRRPEEEVHRTSTLVTIEFPEELAPGHEEMGEIHTRIEPGEQGEYLLTAGMHLLIPTKRLPPDRHLVERGPLPTPWARGFKSADYSGDGGVWVWRRTPLPPGSDKKEAAKLDVRTTLLSGDKGLLAGDPERTLLGHLHDSDTKWVIPVFIDLTDEARIRDYSRSLEMKTYGYAIYAAEPGTYDGPAPAGSPPVGDGPDSKPESEDGDQDDSVSTGQPVEPENELVPSESDGTGPERTIPRETDSGVEAGTGTGVETDIDEGREIDSNTLDPKKEDVTALIREWISVAKPPENAIEGNNFHYSNKGNIIGIAAGGVIESRHETGAFDPVFLWKDRRQLDSINHCTLEEYVVARLEQKSISHCAGRYGAVKDLKGEQLAKAKATVNNAGFEYSLIPGSPAKTTEEGGTIERQEPGPEQYLKKGQTVVLSVHAPYVPAVLVIPDFRGKPLADARNWLRENELKADLKAGRPASTSDKSGMVASQYPAPGTKLKQGKGVKLEVYGPYNPKVAVPDVAGLEVKKAKAKLKAKGLKARLVASGPAPSSGLSLKVKESEPKAGAKVSPGTEVTVKVYGKYSQPFVAVPKVAGLSFSNAKARLARAGLKVSAKSAGPAPSKAKSSRIKSQEPVAGEKVNPGSEVKVYVFSKYIPSDPNEGIEEREQVQAWVLVDTLVNPQNKPTEFIVGVTPNYYSPRYQGSFDKYKVEETYITYKKYHVDRGVIKANIEIRADFTKPPKTLVPGENISLKAKISANGTSPGIGTDVWFKYRAKGINLMGDTFTNSGTNSKPPYRTNSISSYFVVPNTHKGTIEIYASLNCGACDVRWIYRAQKVDQGVK